LVVRLDVDVDAGADGELFDLPLADPGAPATLGRGLGAVEFGAGLRAA
jgi:hypothetical protein